MDGETKEEISFLKRQYPPNYFDVIVIDECHRSAWGAWSEVLTYNSEALQVGLTATPRSLELHDEVKLEKGALEDARITADNIAYFGEPAYSYDISQAVEDGYLASARSSGATFSYRRRLRTNGKPGSTPQT